ncbi:MAG: hypothetical protein ACD_12C00329G0001 [uncultured bacterium]|nr:MAG: hypothetical protein ACD_12C00329G0001 [uncultured bacterium]
MYILGLFCSANFERAVDDPQAKAAPSAYNAAMIVPVPVAKLI